MEYMPQSVCSKKIQFDLDEEDRVCNVKFVGGCAGNQAAVSRLVEGMKRADVIRLLEGIPCGKRTTSCPDQLAQALKELG